MAAGCAESHLAAELHAHPGQQQQHYHPQKYHLHHWWASASRESPVSIRQLIDSKICMYDRAVCALPGDNPATKVDW
jgi:hypothetical protein